MANEKKTEFKGNVEATPTETETIRTNSRAKNSKSAGHIGNSNANHV